MIKADKLIDELYIDDSQSAVQGTPPAVSEKQPGGLFPQPPTTILKVCTFRVLILIILFPGHLILKGFIEKP